MKSTLEIIEHVKLFLFGRLYLLKKWDKIVEIGKRNYSRIPSEGAEIPNSVWDSINRSPIYAFERAYDKVDCEINISSQSAVDSFLANFEESFLLSAKSHYGDNEALFSNYVIKNGWGTLIFLSSRAYSNAETLNAYHVSGGWSSRNTFKIRMKAKTYLLSDTTKGSMGAAVSLLKLAAAITVLVLTFSNLSISKDTELVLFLVAMTFMVYGASVLNTSMGFEAAHLRHEIDPDSISNFSNDSRDSEFVTKDLKEMGAIFVQSVNASANSLSTGDAMARVPHIVSIEE